MYRKFLVAASALMVGLALLAGNVLSRPVPATIGAPPPDLAAQAVALHGEDGATVAGWFVRGKPSAGAVLLVHGVRSDRRKMLQRARFLHSLGYSSLLIDLPAHGESTGQRITFGHAEAQGVKTALAYLAQAVPREPIGAIGVSLGAASLVLAKPQPAPSAMVLESMFPTIRDAVSDRLRLRIGTGAEALAPALLWQLPLWVGVTADDLRPIEELRSLHTPVLIAAGTADHRTTLAETRQIYAAANSPKQLWLVDGAAHVDLYSFDPAGYEAKISGFLAKHLRTQ